MQSTFQVDYAALSLIDVDYQVTAWGAGGGIVEGRDTHDAAAAACPRACIALRTKVWNAIVTLCSATGTSEQIFKVKAGWPIDATDRQTAFGERLAAPAAEHQQASQ